MNMENVNIEKKAQYQIDLKKCMDKYKDKKSELEWADDEFEESLLEQEMEGYAKKVRGLKKVLAAIEVKKQVAKINVDPLKLYLF